MFAARVWGVRLGACCLAAFHARWLVILPIPRCDSLPRNAHENLESVTLNIGVRPLDRVPAHTHTVKGVGKLKASIDVDAAGNLSTRFKEFGDVLVLRDGRQEISRRSCDLPR